ncbi:MAG: hypothetical protein K0S18_103 [Anaerocolumna sp.]|jgi:hypothetical protein|nr:hypothetical protein [Anaerocolumna sp.]
MVLKEEKRDLFNVPEDYYFAHCISADFGMGKGIVVEFNKRYNMKNELIKKYKINNWNGNGYCLSKDRVFNLITKEKYWNKPTYETLRQSLESMKQEMLFFDGMVTKLAIPKIGCGLDRLQWDKVKEIIKDVFNDMEVEILVCYL